MIKLLNVNQVAEILGLTADYVLACATQHPERVPKSFTLHRMRRWKEEDVIDWINSKYNEGVSTKKVG